MSRTTKHARRRWRRIGGRSFRTSSPTRSNAPWSSAARSSTRDAATTPRSGGSRIAAARPRTGGSRRSPDASREAGQRPGCGNRSPSGPAARSAQYVVQEPIGAGGMGVVYKARDERLGRHVALKFLPPALGADRGAKARFVAEARAAAALDHPNVCTIYEIGETGDGQLFIAMPLYDGETLQERMDSRPSHLRRSASRSRCRSRADSTHAHDAGIVHLDVKPSNIVVLPDGTAKMLDFGIAQIHHAPTRRSRTMMGTIPYMSPEQAAGGAVDRRSDIWSLAVVLHEMLAGERPFDGDDGEAVLQAILHADPVLTATSHPDVPASLERVLSTGAREAAWRAPRVDVAVRGRAVGGGERTSRRTVRGDRRSAADVGHRAAPGGRARDRRVGLPALVDRMTPADAHRVIARLRERRGRRRSRVRRRREPGDRRRDRVALRRAVGARRRRSAGGSCGARSARAGARRSIHASSRPRVGCACSRACTSDLSSLVVCTKGRDATTSSARPWRKPAASRSWRTAGDVWVSPETQRLVGPYMHTSACAAVVLDSQADR